MSKKWTEKEVAYLEKYYEKVGTEFIAKKLGRSKISVRKKAGKIGYNAYICEKLYVRTIARCFHSDPSVIYRWIDKFGLPFTKVKRGEMICKLIDVDKFWKWAEVNKELIPWSKYEEHSILPEPLWVKNIVQKKPVKNRTKISCIEIQRVIYLKEKGYSYQQIAEDIGRTIYSVKHIYNSNKEKEKR